MVKPPSKERLEKKAALEKAWPPKSDQEKPDDQVKKKAIKSKKPEYQSFEITETEEELKLRKLRAETMTAEMNAEAKALELLPRREVEDVLSSVMLNVRNKILAIGAMICEELARVSEPSEVLLIINRAHKRALVDLVSMDLKKHFEERKEQVATTRNITN